MLLSVLKSTVYFPGASEGACAEAEAADAEAEDAAACAEAEAAAELEAALDEQPANASAANSANIIATIPMIFLMIHPSKQNIFP
jgi:hypothetical protein